MTSFAYYQVKVTHLHTLARLQRYKSVPVIFMILFTNNRNRLNEDRNRMKIGSYSSRVNNVNEIIFRSKTAVSIQTPELSKTCDVILLLFRHRSNYYDVIIFSDIQCFFFFSFLGPFDAYHH